jgi:pantetheine-phosphate adenylyltransferase
MVKAVYPGTFDPLTRGHEDLVRRAAMLFEEVVVGVADSRGKSPFFTVEERLRLAREVLEPLRNVKVESFSGLLMDFVRGKKARVILRGLRWSRTSVRISDGGQTQSLSGRRDSFYPGRSVHSSRQPS